MRPADRRAYTQQWPLAAHARARLRGLGPCAVGSSLVGTSVPVVIKPTSGAVSATNPSYAFTAVCSEWQNVQGSVGELSTVSATWPISGAITKTVS